MATTRKIPHAEPVEMDAPNTFKNAIRCGVTLSVPKDEDVIKAKPKERITEELAMNIKRNKDELMRYLLLQQAFTFLNQHYVKGADLSVLKKPGDRMDKAESMSEYREAIREYVKAALAEFKRAKQSRSAS
jgi:hypothetical protein